MKLHSKNLSEEFLKNIENFRVPDMHLANNDSPFDKVYMECMLMKAKESGPLIEFSKGEWKNDDES